MTEPDSKPSEPSPKEVAPVESTEPSQPTEASPSGSTSDEQKPPSVASGEAFVADDATQVTQAAEPKDQTAEAPLDESTARGEAEPSKEGSEAQAASRGSGKPAEGQKKKRRRRRRKKGASSSEAPADPKGTHHAPFAHLFAGGAGRKHAFSVGEVIAGRVERVAEGTIIVDLFGKAQAIADADEPREVPIITQSTMVDRDSELPPKGAEAASSESALPLEAGAPVPTVAPEEPADAAAGSPAPDTPGAADPLGTQVSDYPDLGEADTAVGAQAYVEADTVVGAQPYDPTVPPEPDPSKPVQTTPADSPAPERGASTEAAAESKNTDEGTEGETAKPSAPPEDLSDADLSLLEPLSELEPPEVGAIFRGRIGAIAESGHIAIVNREIDKPAVRKAIRAARAKHERVQGVVYGYNRGGFDVLVAGVRAFCPASTMSLTPIEDPSALVGQRCEFSLPQDKGGKKSIIVSRRNILEKEARKRARERMAELEVGARLRGKVTEVRDYGVLVDLGGGLDGLVHMSEVSWSRGVRPSDAANVGDEVEVEVVKLQPATRKDRFGRVSLSMRACQPDPWDLAKDTLRVGNPVKGKVVRTTDFGAFVEIAENIEGLLHISELGGNKELTHAKQALEGGQEVDVVIERVDREQRRVSLSKLSDADAKAIEAGEIEVGKGPRSLKPGSHISVVVKRVEHAGAQVQVDGVLGKRGRGFIPNRELQDHRGERRKGPSQGDVIEVKVIGTERDGTLRCSVRARLLDEERKAVREYRKESAKQGLGTFGDLLKAKLGDSSE